MIVVWPDRSEMDLVHDFASQPQFLSGGVSSGWMEPSEEPTRPIGFRMPEPEPVIDDPSWMLL